MRRLVASAPIDVARRAPRRATAWIAAGAEGDVRAAGAGRPRAAVPLALGGREVARVVLEGETLESMRAHRRTAGEAVRFALLALAGAVAAACVAASARARRLPSGARCALWVGLTWGARLLLAAFRPARVPGAPALFEPEWFAGPAPLGLLRSPADLFLTVAAVAATVWFADRAWARAQPGVATRGAARRALALAALAAIPLAWWAGVRLVSGAVHAAGPRLFDTPVPRPEPTTIALILALTLFGFAFFRVLVLLAGASGLAGRPLGLAAALVALGALPFLARNPAVAPVAGLVPSAALLGITLAAAVALVRLGRGEPPAEFGRSALLLLGASLALLPGVDRGLELRDRERVQGVAARFATPRDEWRRFVLEETLDFFIGRPTLVAALTRATPGGAEAAGGAGAADAAGALGPAAGPLGLEDDAVENLAYAEWAASPLASLGYECALEILNAAGAVVSRFSVGIPAESGYRATFAFRDARETRRPVIVASRRRIGRETVDTYLGTAPILSEDGDVIGAVVVTIPYFFENLAFATRPDAQRPLVLGARAGARAAVRGGAGAAEPPTELAGRLVVSRFERGRLVASSDPTILPGLVLPGGLAATPPGRFWEGSLYGGREATLLAALSGETALAFTLARSGAPALGARLVHIALAGAVLLIGRALVAAARALLSRRSRPASFREKLLAAFLIIAVIPAALMGVLTYRLTTQRQDAAARREAAEGLDAVRAHLRERSVAEATRLSESTLIRRLTLGLEPMTAIDLETGLKKFSVFRADGELLLQNGVVPEVPSELVLRVASSLAPETFFSPEDGLSIASAVPIVFEGEREPGKGVLLLRTAVDGALLAELGAEGNRDLFAYAPSGLVATNRPELVQSGTLSPRMPAHEHVDCFLNRKEAVYGTAALADVRYVVAYGALAGLSGETVGALAVPLLFRQREIREDVGRALASILYLTVIVLVLVSFLATFVANRIAQPVAELSAGTARVARGDLAFSLRRTSGGELGQLVDSFNRMTEEVRKSRDRILERTRYIEAIIGTMTTGVLALDREGRITTLNGGGARILGLPEGAGIGRPASWLRDGVRDAIAETLEAIGGAPGGVLEREIALPRGRARAGDGAGGDGEEDAAAEPVLSVRAVGTRLLNTSGEEIGRVLVFEDLTELIRSKKLLAWSEMARQVAHEIKNPLTPMKLSAQQIRKAYHDRAAGFGGILEEGTEAIIREIESLRRIATEFSQFARMPRRRVRDEDLNEIVRESARFYGEGAGAVALELDLAAEAPRARVDRDEMKRVFMNLIENAVQASAAGGRVRVRTLATRAEGRPSAPGAGGAPADAFSLDGAAPPGGFVAWSGRPPARGRVAVVLVEDAGVGIAADFRARLFEPYFSTKTDGTGLGLAICKGIVDEHGGAIRVASAAGRGTSVAVVVPAAG
jgi:signal transduction histidine kinase